MSVLLVVPTRAAIPAWFRARCPVVEVRRRVAQWQAPEGRWDWAQPTVLRLPWRDPQRSWSQLPGQAHRPVTPLPALEGFWAVPLDLRGVLGSGMGEAARLENLPGLQVVPPAALTARAAGPGTGRSSRCRVYDVPARAATPAGSAAASTQAQVGAAMAGDVSRSPHLPEPLPPVPAPGTSGSGQPAPIKRAVYRATEPLPPLPGAPVPATGNPRYTPREDGEGNLVVDPQLLALTLQWAEQIDPDNQGVSITRFKSGVGLPSKAHSFQLRDALRTHGLIRRELKKEGWYRLLTVEEAVSAGKLPPGPWYTPPPEACPAVAPPLAEPTGTQADTVDVPPAPDGAAMAARDVIDDEVPA